jgi:hypothetical protein
MQKIIREYFENLLLSRLDKFVDAYNQSKLNQEDTNQLNSLVTSNEIKAVIKSLPRKKSPGPDGVIDEF